MKFLKKNNSVKVPLKRSTKDLHELAEIYAKAYFFVNHL